MQRHAAQLQTLAWLSNFFLINAAITMHNNTQSVYGMPAVSSFFSIRADRRKRFIFRGNYLIIAINNSENALRNDVVTK